MALLQIAEPGLSTSPHQHRLAIGIDLGTTHSLVATVQSGAATCLPDADGRVLLPSVVYYTPDRRVLTGDEALHCAAAVSVPAIASVKRLMGRSLGDVQHLKLPYPLRDTGAMPAIITAAGDKSPVEVSAEILRSLRQRAEASLGVFDGDSLTGAVITVPAYFDEGQRQATKDAAQLAGIRVLRLLNEPTAAAIAYGLDHQSAGCFVVFDLGGGTFDVSILRLSRGVFEVVATGGDAALGGDDFDRLLAEYVQARDGLGALPRAAFAALVRQCRHAKEALSGEPAVRFEFIHEAQRWDIGLTAAELAQVAAPLIDKALSATRQTLRAARLKAEAIDGVVMVGGSTRMIAVREAVEAFFEQPLLTDVDPDQVVALGAALQADVLAGNRPANDDWLLLDVIPLSLGLETMGGLTERIIDRNTTLPAARAQEFTTFKDGQTALALHVVQGERELVSENRSLARFELRGIPPLAAGAARVRVTFQVDADGLLSVTARELTSGVEAHTVVKPSYGLSDEDIARMLKAGFEMAATDMLTRSLREKQVDADRLLEALNAALARDASLLGAAERAAIMDAVQRLRDARQTADTALLTAAIDALSTASEDFAARRMNASIAQALTGKTLEEL